MIPQMDTPGLGNLWVFMGKLIEIVMLQKLNNSSTTVSLAGPIHHGINTLEGHFANHLAKFQLKLGLG